MRECCAIVLTETWLNPSVSGDASIEWLTMFRSDRSCVLSRKSWGGVVCIYTNNSWCNSPTVISSHCSLDVEFLSIKCRPFYLPREYTTIIITPVYIPPCANTKKVLNVLHRFISDLQDSHPEGVFIVAQEILTKLTWGQFSLISISMWILPLGV